MSNKFFTSCGLAILLIGGVNADCLFKVINYANKAVTAQVGFYGGNSKTLLVEANSTAIESMPSSYNCIASTDFGSGRAFILFPKDPGGAGANYSPAQDGLNLLGQVAGSANARLLIADDGAKLWLTASGKAVNEEKFEVQIKRTTQANSRVAGTD